MAQVTNLTAYNRPTVPVQPAGFSSDSSSESDEDDFDYEGANKQRRNQ